jgi:hypothetical protein
VGDTEDLFRRHSAGPCLAIAIRASWASTDVDMDHDQLGAVAGAELGQDPGDVGLDGCGTHIELAADLGVRQTLGDEGEHVPLALGNPVDQRFTVSISRLVKPRLGGDSVSEAAE